MRTNTSYGVLTSLLINDLRDNFFMLNTVLSSECLIPVVLDGCFLCDHYQDCNHNNYDEVLFL